MDYIEFRKYFGKNIVAFGGEKQDSPENRIFEQTIRKIYDSINSTDLNEERAKEHAFIFRKVIYMQNQIESLF